jgi:hypothetical protein
MNPTHGFLDGDWLYSLRRLAAVGAWLCAPTGIEAIQERLADLRKLVEDTRKSAASSVTGRRRPPGRPRDRRRRDSLRHYARGDTDSLGSTVFSLTPLQTSGAPWTETVLHNFGNHHDGINPVAGRALSGDRRCWIR